MHEASKLGHEIKEAAPSFGWESDYSASSSSTEGGGGGVQWRHNWSKLVKAVQDHIHSLNFNYENLLRNDDIDYINDLAEFKDANTLVLSNSKKQVSASSFVIAVGGRPKLLQIPGGEHAITSDDLFSRKSLFASPSDSSSNKDSSSDSSSSSSSSTRSVERVPRVLVVGGSYVALECAGVLTGLGVEVQLLIFILLLRKIEKNVL
jgi:thioredoxin reductase (NADPH)